MKLVHKRKFAYQAPPTSIILDPKPCKLQNACILVGEIRQNVRDQYIASNPQAQEIRIEAKGLHPGTHLGSQKQNSWLRLKTDGSSPQGQSHLPHLPLDSG